MLLKRIAFFAIPLIVFSSIFVINVQHSSAVAQCADGVDNDGDGAVDFTGSPNRGDQGCSSANDNDEGFRLRVSVSGKGTVTTTGINCSTASSLPTCKAEYDNNTPLTLVANAATGFTFREWVGACTGSTQSCLVNMTQARDVLAVFQPTGSFTLTVQQSGVIGTLFSNPAGINGCSTATCSGTFPAGTTVRIYEMISSNNADGTQMNWSGCEQLDYEPVSSGGLTIGQKEADCEVVVDANKNISVFVGTKSLPDSSPASTFPFSIRIIGSGAGRVTGVNNFSGITVLHCGSDFTPLDREDTSGCNESVGQWANFGARNTVTLTASPNLANGSTFGGWGGACSGTQSTCTLSVDQAKNVTATFNNSSNIPKYRIYAKRISTLIPDNGNHGATVTSSPGGISCGSDCGEFYQSGTQLNLTPALAAGYDYEGDFYTTYLSFEDGMCIGSAPLCRIYVSQPYHIQTKSGPVCNDKVDNDGDVLIDGNGVGGNARDPQCVAPVGYNENTNGTTEGPATPSTSNYTLNITKNLSTGTGLVTTSGTYADPINCGSDCTGVYAQNTNVTLQSAPTTGHYFGGWSNCTVQTDLARCIADMVSDKTVNAQYISGPACNDAIDNDEDGLMDFAGSAVRSIKKGDIIQNGIVDIFDAEACLQIAEPYPYSSVSAYRRIAADVNNDGRITVGANQNDLNNITDDCNIILRWTSGLQTPARPNNVVVNPDPQCTSSTGTTEAEVTALLTTGHTSLFGGSGGVSISVNGTPLANCDESSSVCNYNIPVGSSITLTQNQNSTSIFTRWVSSDTTSQSTDCPSGSPCTFVLNGNKTVYAEFRAFACSDTSNGSPLDNDVDGLSNYPNDPGCTSSTDDDEGPRLLTRVTGSGQVTVSTASPLPAYPGNNPPWIFNCTSNLGPNNCYDHYNSNTSVTIGAVPNPGFSVVWNGCNSTSGNSCVVGLTNVSREVTAVFSALPACSNGIDDDGDGLIDYPNDPGCTSGTDTDEGVRLTVVVTGPNTASVSATSPANPLPNPPSITACIQGGATNICTEHYALNTPVTLTAVVPTGYSLSWANCTPGAGNTCSTIMSNTKNVNATFTANNGCNDGIDNDGDGLVDSADPGCSGGGNDEKPKLQVNVVGPGTITVNSSPAGITNCNSSNSLTSACNEHFTTNILVTLTSSSANTNWTGCDSGLTSGTTCVVTMNSSKTVQAELRTQCNDGIDNDLDGKIDYPADTDCTSRYGATEGITASCSATPNPALSYEDVVWTVTTVNGCTFPTSTYNYSWTGDVVANNFGSHSSSDSQTRSYENVGIKTANVSVFASDQETPASCSGSVQTSCQIEVIDSLRLTSGHVDDDPTKALGSVRMRILDTGTLCIEPVCTKTTNATNPSAGVTAIYDSTKVAFDNWVESDGFTPSAICPERINPCNFNLSQNTIVYAKFSTLPGPNLTVVKVGERGKVRTVQSLPPQWIDCGDNTTNDCFEQFDTSYFGKPINLSATAEAGSRFVGWGGDCSDAGTNTTCTLTLNGVHNVIATFEIIAGQCTDGIDNDQDGFCDVAGCVIAGQNLPPDPECAGGGNNEGITAYCTVTPASATTGEQVTWNAYVRNACTGSGAITTYSWQGSLLGEILQQVLRVYSVTGTYDASVMIVSRPNDGPWNCGGIAVSPLCTNANGGHGVNIIPEPSAIELRTGVEGITSSPGHTGGGAVTSLTVPITDCDNISDCGPYSVQQGDPVTLNATPDEFSIFIKWVGGPCDSNTTPDCTFSMPGSAVTSKAQFRRAECSDGIDNDGSNGIDFGDPKPPFDASCSAANDDQEGGSLGECDDGLDNNDNGTYDQFDLLSCYIDGRYAPAKNEVAPDTGPANCPADGPARCTRCNDGVDNDQDRDQSNGGIDYAGYCVGAPNIRSQAPCSAAGGRWYGPDPFCQGDPNRNVESFTQLFQEF